MLRSLPNRQLLYSKQQLLSSEIKQWTALWASACRAVFICAGKAETGEKTSAILRRKNV